MAIRRATTEICDIGRKDVRWKMSIGRPVTRFWHDRRRPSGCSVGADRAVGVFCTIKTNRKGGGRRTNPVGKPRYRFFNNRAMIGVGDI